MSRAETIDLADLPVDMARPDAIAVGNAPGPSKALREAVRRYETALLQESPSGSRPHR